VGRRRHLLQQQTAKWRCVSHVLDGSINKKERKDWQILSSFPFYSFSLWVTNKTRDDDKVGKNRTNRQTKWDDEDFLFEDEGGSVQKIGSVVRHRNPAVS
jgi:hypothetical protein